MSENGGRYNHRARAKNGKLWESLRNLKVENNAIRKKLKDIENLALFLFWSLIGAGVCMMLMKIHYIDQLEAKIIKTSQDLEAIQADVGALKSAYSDVGRLAVNTHESGLLIPGSRVTTGNEKDRSEDVVCRVRKERPGGLVPDRPTPITSGDEFICRNSARVWEHVHLHDVHDPVDNHSDTIRCLMLDGGRVHESRCSFHAAPPDLHEVRSGVHSESCVEKTDLGRVWVETQLYFLFYIGGFLSSIFFGVCFLAIGCQVLKHVLTKIIKMWDVYAKRPVAS